MKSTPASTTEIVPHEKFSSWLAATLKSTLVLFFTLFPMVFLHYIFHEGGHALAITLMGGKVQILYAHPFSFTGYSRPALFLSSIWSHISGPLVGVLGGVIIYLIFRKRRTIPFLPLLLLLPQTVCQLGYGMVLQTLSKSGDFNNLARLTGLPPALFYGVGIPLFVIGLFWILVYYPLLGLAPKDKKSFIVIPAAQVLAGLFSLGVAYLFVPGSSIDIKFHLGNEIISSAKEAPPMGILFGVILAVVYFTLVRLIYPKLPAGWRIEKVNLTWRDLRIPAVVWAVSVVVGIIVIL